MPAVGPALLCYDGSDPAGRAIRLAATVLRPQPAVVIHVSEKGVKDDVAESGRRRAIAAGFDPVSVVEARHGPIGRVILKEARERGASVIVVLRSALP
jgi:nucleotide-binding universal stress UspA family protein